MRAGELGQCSVWLRTGRPWFDPRQRQRFFPLTSASRPALGPTQPPMQRVPGALSPGVKRGRGVMLTTHPLLLPRLRKGRSYTSCHPKAPLERSGTTLPYLFYPLMLSIQPSPTEQQNVRIYCGPVCYGRNGTSPLPTGGSVLSWN
jgi:hypothetical protein